jgi:DNA end-binding protein Ku
LSTLVFPDELVDPAQTEGFEVLDGVTLSDKELLMARSLVDALTEAFEPTRYVDEYRTSLESLIEQKAAGLTPVAVAAAAPRGAVIDLASALEASLREAKAARERHPAGAPVLEVVPDAADDDAAAEPAPARKPRARRTA